MANFAWKMEFFVKLAEKSKFLEFLLTRLHDSLRFQNKSSLSSLHISIHHYIFCASLHVKASLALRDSIDVTKRTVEKTVEA